MRLEPKKKKKNETWFANVDVQNAESKRAWSKMRVLDKIGNNMIYHACVIIIMFVPLQVFGVICKNFQT